MAKNYFFGQKFLWQANKNSFELKMTKFLENHVKHMSRNGFLLFQPNQIFFEFLTKSAKNVFFFKKIKILALFS